MKKKILHFLNQNPNQSYKARDLIHHLGISPADRKRFCDALKEVSCEGAIHRYKGGGYASMARVPTLMGRLKVHAQGYGFVLTEDSSQPDIFIPAPYIGDALPDDKVLVTYQQNERDHRYEGRVHQIVERGRSIWTGRLEKHGNKASVVNRDYKDEIRIFVSHQNLQKARDGQVVSVRVTQYPAFKVRMEGEIVEVLGDPYEEKTEIKLILAKHGIQKDFSQLVQKAAKALPSLIQDDEISRRMDLRGLPFITIDGLNAKDFDDAVYAEQKGQYIDLYVSIADVAHYVSRRDPLDQEALQRGTSTYFPDFVCPMLPERLSNDLCSLRSGEDKLTLTCQIRFNSEGEMLHAQYFESVIQSRKRGIYEEVQSFIDQDAGAEDDFCPEVKRSLGVLQKLALLLIKKREQRGSIDFDLPEAQVVYDHTGQMTAFVKAKRFFAHRLIEECMIAANRAVARLFVQKNIPGLFRVHDVPDPIKIKEFELFLKNIRARKSHSSFKHPKDFARLLKEVSEHPMEPLIHQIMLRCMKQAFYDSHCRGHFGLGLKHYCHFTSPIRRYPDLVVHRQLKAMIHQRQDRTLCLSFNEKVKSHHADSKKLTQGLMNLKELESIGKVTSDCERQSMEAEREMMNYKRTLFMQDHIGSKFYGTVRRVTSFGLFVELEPHFVEGLLHVRELTDDYYRFDKDYMRLVGQRKKKNQYCVGDKIWVKVSDVSLERREVVLAIC